jgi:hypothetical protein
LPADAHARRISERELDRGARRAALLLSEACTKKAHRRSREKYRGFDRLFGAIEARKRPLSILDPASVARPHQPGGHTSMQRHGGSTPVPTRFDNIFANEDEQSAAARYSSSDEDITEATNTRRNNYLRCFGDRAARTFDADRKKLLTIGNFWYD